MLSEIWRLNYLTSTLLFFGVPSVYISLRRPSIIKKTLIFTLVFATPMIYILDYMAYVDLSWWVPGSAFRILHNSIPIEDVPWSYLWVYYAVSFWEFFLDHDRVKVHIDHHFRFLIAVLASLSVLFFGAYFFKPEILMQNYFYLKLGIVFIIIPMTAVLVKFPHLLRKIIILGAYFFMVNLLTEFVGLRQVQWAFIGKNYIDTFSWMGYKIPLEEIVFYWILSVPAIICWYEYFADDRK